VNVTVNVPSLLSTIDPVRSGKPVAIWNVLVPLLFASCTDPTPKPEAGAVTTITSPGLTVVGEPELGVNVEPFNVPVRGRSEYDAEDSLKTARMQLAPTVKVNVSPAPRLIPVCGALPGVVQS
jgi:hypothetical protein